MEDIRPYCIDDDETLRIIGRDDDTVRVRNDRRDFADQKEDREVPFDIPRD